MKFIALLFLPLFIAAQSPVIKNEVIISENIKGDLYLPEKSNGNLVVVIAGSGPTNRDGNQPGMRTNAYKLLAQSLAEKGNPIFTFDKRIVTQLITGKADESKLNFDDQIEDVRDIIRHFRKDKSIKKIILCGHSEGSTIGMVAAQGMADGYISLAGPGRSADLIITDQIAKQAPFLKESVEESFAKLRKGETFVLDKPMLAAIFKEDLQPFMISWIKYDPSAEIKKLKIPVLILNGTKDLQVDVPEAELLKSAKPDAKLVLIENMNHVLKEVASEGENTASYNKPELPVSDKLVSAISEYLKAFL